MNFKDGDFLEEFDGVRSNTVFCLWSGSNAMSPQRIQALWSIYNNTHCQVAFISAQTVRNWEKQEHPFHPAYDLLSDTHKSDYLRCYLMHHYGGGWADIKHTRADWRPFFTRLRQSTKYALGYQELPDGIPHLTGNLGNEIRRNYRSVIGLCAFIFKKQTHITSGWLSSLHQTLDHFYPALLVNPAKHPQDQPGMKLNAKEISEYPIAWASILGELLHPLLYENQAHIIQDEIQPLFHSYR